MIRRIALLFVNECAKCRGRWGLPAWVVLVLAVTVLAGLWQFRALGGHATPGELRARGTAADLEALFERRNGWLVMIRAFTAGSAAAALAVLVWAAGLIAEERQLRTLAPNLLRPVRRIEWFAAKTLMLVVMALGLAALVGLAAHLVGGLTYQYHGLFHCYLAPGSELVHWVWESPPNYSYEELWGWQWRLALWLPVPLVAVGALGLALSAASAHSGQALAVALVAVLVLAAVAALGATLRHPAGDWVFLRYLMDDARRFDQCAQVFNGAPRPFEDPAGGALPRLAACAGFTALGLAAGGLLVVRRDVGC